MTTHIQVLSPVTTKELVACFEPPKDINEMFFQYCHRSNYPETVKAGSTETGSRVKLKSGFRPNSRRHKQSIRILVRLLALVSKLSKQGRLQRLR